MKTLTLCEGFWYSKHDRELPRPVGRDKPWKGKRKFLKALSVAEAKAQSKRFKGWSNCRICDCANGSATRELTYAGITWRWPSGFAHYVEEHNVRPSLAFQQFISAYSGDPLKVLA